MWEWKKCVMMYFFFLFFLEGIEYDGFSIIIVIILFQNSIKRGFLEKEKEMTNRITQFFSLFWIKQNFSRTFRVVSSGEKRKMKNFLLIPPKKINNKKPLQVINRKRSFLVFVTNSTVHIHIVRKDPCSQEDCFQQSNQIFKQTFYHSFIKMFKQRDTDSQKNRKYWSTHRQEEGENWKWQINLFKVDDKDFCFK